MSRKGADDGIHDKRDGVPHASEAERFMRLGRALDANVMLHLGSMLSVAHA